jgi:hypothetical protein
MDDAALAHRERRGGALERPREHAADRAHRIGQPIALPRKPPRCSMPASSIR